MEAVVVQVEEPEGSKLEGAVVVDGPPVMVDEVVDGHNLLRIWASQIPPFSHFPPAL